MRVRIAVPVAMLASICVSGAKPASSLPAIIFQPVLTGISNPVAITAPDDGTHRLFVTRQSGQIMVSRTGQATPFLDISALVQFSGEQGLLSTAFHPNYASDGTFFVYYVRKPDNALVIARYHVSSGDPDAADPNSAQTILVIAHPTNTNHNGGQLEFGNDGFLYIGTGDGGGAGDPAGNAQNRNVLLGKILRIDVDHGTPYAVPATNPLVGVANTRPEIWSYGLRNPWRFTFDRSTHDMWIGDVGQDNREEIDLEPPAAGGRNYGWNTMEGTACYPATASCNPAGLTPPVYDYPHANGDCSVTGGYRYRGSLIPGLAGVYVFGDFCTGGIWGLAQGAGGTWGSSLIADTTFSISTFGEDENGEVYVADRSGGTIFRLVGPPLPSRPAVVRQAGWYLRSSLTSGVADATFAYGFAADIAVMGDWNGDGVKTPGVFRDGVWYLRNANTSGNGDIRFVFGQPGDVPVVGDWTGGGHDLPGVFRNGTWFLRSAASGGPPDAVFTFGQQGDLATAGDWTGAGHDLPGVYRNGTWFQRVSLTSGVADVTFSFGVAGDVPVAGDWTAGGRDLPGLLRGGTWFLRDSSTSGVADTTFFYGSSGDRPSIW